MTEAIIILALIIANGLFSGAELAVISLQDAAARAIIDEGHARARAGASTARSARAILGHGAGAITVIGAAAAAFGGDVFAERLARLVAHAGLLAPYAKQIGFALVVGTISFLSLVLGELVPKSLALRSNEGYAMFMGPVLLGLSHPRGRSSGSSPPRTWCCAVWRQDQLYREPACPR